MLGRTLAIPIQSTTLLCDRIDISSYRIIVPFVYIRLFRLAPGHIVFTHNSPCIYNSAKGFVLGDNTECSLLQSVLEVDKTFPKLFSSATETKAFPRARNAHGEGPEAAYGVRVSEQLSATITSDSFFLCSGRARPNSGSGFR